MQKLNYTVPINCNPIYSSADGKMIDIDVIFPDLGRVRYTSAAIDPGYEHSEEIYERAVSGEFGAVAPYNPPPTEPDYISFWDALMSSNLYAAIREQSFTSLPLNTLATELIALLGDAKAGRANEAAIQQGIEAVLFYGTFTEEQLAELQEALVAGHLDTIYTLES